MESVTILFPDADCFTSLYLLCSTSYLLFPESDWLILLLKLLWLISYLQQTVLQYLHTDCMMVVMHLDCCLCCTILMTIEMISAITATANNVDKATITPLLSLTLSPSEQLQETTEKATVVCR